MKTPLVLRVCFIVLFTLVSFPLFAWEPDWPDADEVLREATRIALQFRPGSAGADVKQRIANDELERGGYLKALEFVENCGEEERKNSGAFLIQNVFPAVLESFDVGLYQRYLNVVPEYNRYHVCNQIIQYCFEHGRLMDESLLLPESLTENQFGHKSLLLLELPNIVLARECSKIEADGSVAQTAQRTAFRLFDRYNGRQERFLVAKWFWASSDQQEKLREAIRLVKADEDEKAKALFTEAFNAIPNEGTPNVWGAYNPGDALCAIALMEIELGKPEWAKELIPQIVIPPRDNTLQQYALSLRMKIADLQLMLGEPAGARKTIEALGDPIEPLVWSDLAVAVAQSGDKQSAKELLGKVGDALEKETHSGRYERDAAGLFDAALETGDPEITQCSIDLALKASETNNFSDKPKKEITRRVIKTLIRLQRFDEARELLQTLEETHHFYESRRDYTDGLIVVKRYRDAEDYLDSVQKSQIRDDDLCANTMRKIAKAKFDDGNKAGAVDAIRAAIRYAGDGSALLVDIALDVKYVFSSQPGRPPAESVNEVLRWHRELMDRQSTDARDYTEEELLHLLRTVGNGYSSDAAKAKLRGMGNSIYPVIFNMVREPDDGRHLLIGEIFELVDIAQADRNEIRVTALALREKYPGYEKCYEVLGETGLPEDVPGLLKWEEYVHVQVVPAFHAVAKIATASQLPEIEKAAEDAEKVYFKRCEEVQNLEKGTAYWNETLKPEIDKALQTLRERK